MQQGLQKVFAYGIRNGFGMAFDPFSGKLWEAQNRDDSFTELNLVAIMATLLELSRLLMRFKHVP